MCTFFLGGGVQVVWVVDPDGKIQPTRPRHRWEYNIEVGLKKGWQSFVGLMWFRILIGGGLLGTQ